MKVEMPRAGVARGRGLGGQVRLHSTRRRVENELRHRWPPLRHEHEPVARIGADVMRHRPEANSQVSPPFRYARQHRWKRRNRPLLLIAVIRHEQPPARPIGRQVRGDAAHGRHVVDRCQLAGRLIDGERADPAWIGFVDGKEDFAAGSNARTYGSWPTFTALPAGMSFRPPHRAGKSRSPDGNQM